jgi:dTDP-4-amino-4,6-dideoxy-D-galactose acyltransferase
MATLGDKNERGDIGLLAVAADKRGQGLGIQIVNGALQEFKAKGYELAQVVTQQDNIPACRLYERCGFTVEKVENFYHFWL